MIRGLSVGVCLPCRNEAAHLGEVIATLPDFVDEVVVVSNCSSDDTVRVARDLGVRVIEDDRTVRGIGYGFAHMSGIAACRSDIVVAADGDGSYPLEDIGRLVEHLLERDLDFVSCNRYPLRDGTSIPWSLRVGVGLLNLEVRLLYGFRLRDTLSGMWVFRRDVWPVLGADMGDWNFSPEIKLRAAVHPAVRFGETGIVQHQRQGVSHQRYLRTGFSHAWWIVRHRFGAGAPSTVRVSVPVATLAADEVDVA